MSGETPARPERRRPSQVPLGPAGIALLYAAFAVAWIALSHFLLVVVTDDETVRGRIEFAKGLAFVLATSAMLYFLLRGRARSLDDAPRSRKRTAAVFLATALAVPVVGVSVYLVQRGEEQESRIKTLAALSHLKASQIARWVKERRADGEALLGSKSFAASWRKLAEREDPASLDIVRERLDVTLEAYDYAAIVLFAGDGRPLAAVGDEAVSAKMRVPPAAVSRQARVEGPYRESTGEGVVDIVLPLHDALAGKNPTAILVLRARTRAYLDPEIAAWPAVSATGAFRVLRRVGEDIVCVHRPDPGRPSGEPTRIPIGSGEFLEARAVAAAEPGTMVGVDHRGTPVLGGWHPVAGTDWVVVARTDSAEAFARTREMAYWVTGVALVSLLIAGAAVMAYLRQSLRSQQLAAQTESDRLLRHFYQLPFIGMAITSAETRKWVRFNDRLCEILGYSRDEVTRMTWVEMTHPEDVGKDVAQFERCLAGQSDGYAIEKRFIRKDGKVVVAEIDVKAVRREDGSPDYFVATVQDVTERAAAREWILRQARFYAGLSACDAAIARCRNRDELFDTICRVAVEAAGLRLAWIGLVSADGKVSVSAAYGAGVGYLQDIAITVRGDEPSGWGPSGTAIRENEPFWCNDFLGDPRTGPWHERGRDFGFRSSAALPIRRGGRAIGAITLYAGELNAFDEDARRLLVDLTASLSFAIDNFDREEASRQAESRLAASEARYRTAFLTSPDAMTITDLFDGVYIDVNEGFTRTFGWSREEVVGRTSKDIGIWQRLEDRQGLIDAVSATGRCAGFEAPLRTKDGRAVTTLVTAHHLELDGRHCMMAVTRDITERKQAEDAVRKLSLAVEQSPESIAITNLDAEIEYVNRAFLEVTGYSREEVIGRNPRILHSGLTPSATYEAMWASLTRGEPWKGEFVNRRKDGSEYVELAIVAPIRQEDGTVTHYLAIKDDITERKRAAEELERHRHHLEDLVTSRTAELAEARERAETANAAKSTFLATMSHEIRTPMNAIIGLTHLLRRDDPRAGQADRLAKLEASARHLLALISDVLDISKIEAGKFEIDHHPFALGAILDEVGDLLRARAQEKGIDLRVERDGGCPAVIVGDALRLRQVLINVGGNAVKFTEAGSVTLAVVVRTADADRVRLRFEVTDTGIGLTDEQRLRLFMPFEQADSSTSRRYGGTGLGLAICRRLVELMGGEIGVESEAGAGSTFWFELPFARSAESALMPVAIAPARAAGPEGASRPLRILLVEDDPVNQEVAKELLGAWGHDVVLAGDGAQAVAIAATNAFDLVLMDMQMPVMDGLEATRAIRRLPRHEATPILAMTANVLQEDRRRCLEAGMNDFIGKPVEPDAMLRTISRWAPAWLQDGSTGDKAAGGAPSMLVAAIAKIEGLDARDGLRRMQGREADYVRLLRRFATRQVGDAGTLRARLAERDFDAAIATAHALKGTAGNLGAVHVRVSAAALETALRAGERSPASLDPLVAALDKANRQLADALAVRLPPPHAASEPVVDAKRLRDLVARLDALMVTADIRAPSLFREEEAMLRAALGEAAESIGSSLDAFDYTAALDTLRKVLADNPDLA